MPERFHWRYFKGRIGDFPELYLLEKKDATIHVEVNRKRGLVRLEVETPDKHIQSVISHGVILRERDLRLQRGRSLEKDFEEFARDISSLPDSSVLKLIGGNYGILAEFTGKVIVYKPYEEKEPFLKRIKNQIKGFSQDIKSFFISLPKALFTRPSWKDLVEIGAGIGTSYFIYQWNFNFLLTGVFLLFYSLLTGFFDILIRKKEPFLMKVFFLFAVGVVGVYIGLRYQ